MSDDTPPGLVSKRVHCPYCGETIEVLVDSSEANQCYIEDCQVCCRPIEVAVSVDFQGSLLVTVMHENE